eukprot:5132543-Pleurochrysis_carterae.AAC.1
MASTSAARASPTAAAWVEHSTAVAAARLQTASTRVAADVRAASNGSSSGALSPAGEVSGGGSRCAGIAFNAAGKSVCLSGRWARGGACWESEVVGLPRSGATAARASATESTCRGEGRIGGGGGGKRYRAA